MFYKKMLTYLYNPYNIKNELNRLFIYKEYIIVNIIIKPDIVISLNQCKKSVYPTVGSGPYRGIIYPETLGQRLLRGD